MPDMPTSIPIVSPPRVLELTAADGKILLSCYNMGSGSFTGYVGAFDPEFADGVGGVDLVQDQAKALRFKDFASALVCWKMQSKTKPRREDGKPNRPLTAFTVEVVKL